MPMREGENGFPVEMVRQQNPSLRDQMELASTMALNVNHRLIAILLIISCIIINFLLYIYRQPYTIDFIKVVSPSSFALVYTIKMNQCFEI